MTQTKEVSKINPAEFGLDETKANDLTKNLHSVLKERDVLIGEYEKIILLEITRENVPAFKDLRIKIRDNRTKGIEVWHKANKEFFLSGGRFIDAIKNKESVLNKQMEEKLEEAEKWEQLQEEKRIEALRVERTETLKQYEVDTSLVQVGLMTDDVWNNYLSGVKLSYEQKKAAEAKAEADRIESARLDKLEYDRKLEIAPYTQFISESGDLRRMSEEEFRLLISNCQIAKIDYEKNQEEIRIENERLKKESEEKEQRIKDEKAKADAEAKRAKEEADAKLKKEQDKANKLAAELKAKADAEEAEKEKERLALKKAQAASDKVKLEAYAQSIDNVRCATRPQFKDDEPNKILLDAENLLVKVSAFVREKAASL